MRTVYIDSEFKCHLTDDGTRTAVETPAFDGKCGTFIEGYRFIPKGKTRIGEDGEAYQGEQVTPWKDYNLLEAAQAQHETTLAEMDAAYREGVNSV